MISLFRTNIGRLRIIGFLEGISLITLVFIAMPLKYGSHNDTWVKTLGPVHGALFLLFVLNTLSVAVSEGWKFKDTTWKILLSCLIPLGTFYIDRNILSAIKQ